MLFDSNVIIDYLNGDTEVVNLLRGWKEERRQLSISPITITEVLALPKLNEQEIKIAQSFLAEFIVLPLDETIAQIAAIVCRQYDTKTPDSLIAATAIRYDMSLVSRDRVFRKIKDLSVIV